MKIKLSLLAIVLITMVATAASAADIKLGTFTSQSAAVKAIGANIPTLEVGLKLDQTEFTRTDLTFTSSYATELFNQSGSFLRAGAALEKRYTIGDPDAKVLPYVGAGIGGYYYNGGGESGFNAGASLIGGIRINEIFTIETKYTDIRRSQVGDGFSVTVGMSF